MRRNEFKYRVANEHLDNLRSSILSFVNKDPNSPDNTWRHEYTVRSIYFDTIKFDYFHEKRHGIKTRKKIRIRSYNKLVDFKDQNPEVFLEVKRKEIDFISKNRSRVLWNDLGPAIKTGDIDKYVLQSDNPKIWNEASRFFFHLKSRNLRPVVLVVYEREAYFSKFDPSFRVSIDKNIRSLAFPKVEDLFEDSGLEAGFYKDFVLEVKFSGAIPAWMKDILFKYKLTRQSVSKYKLSLDHNKIFTTKHWLQVYNMGL